MTSAQNPPADLILFNGAVHTQDRRRPAARAVAVAGRRIVAVGDDTAIASLGGRLTERIDLEGRSVLPGMTDPHCHFYEWALQRRRLDLSAAGSIDDLCRRVSAAAERIPAGEWLLGRGWNEADWPRLQMPDRRLLDAAAPDHPVVLWRCDMHMAAANSRALSAAAMCMSQRHKTTG